MPFSFEVARPGGEIPGRAHRLCALSLAARNGSPSMFLASGLASSGSFITVVAMAARRAGAASWLHVRDFEDARAPHGRWRSAASPSSACTWRRRGEGTCRARAQITASAHPKAGPDALVPRAGVPETRSELH